MVVIVFCSNSKADNNKLCGDENITNELRGKIQVWMQHAHPGSALLCGNILWPSCKDTLNVIRNVPSKSLDKNAYWIQMFYLPRIYGLDSVVVLKNMRNGDEWIINRYSKENEYYQYIDGRSLTLLIKIHLNIKDTSNMKRQWVRQINKYVHINLSSMKIINHDSTQIDMAIDNGFKAIDYPTEIKLWSNGEYIIIDIPKIREPFIDKFGLSVFQTIGGIPPDDPRPFIRFGENRIDMRKEAYKHVPDIDKTLEKRRKDFEFGGEPVKGYIDGH